MTDDTRRMFLDTARRLFAGKGFYGASLANIADELGLTKQALLHHFGSAKAVAQAGLADLETVDGMSRTVARKIYDHFNPTS